MDELVESYTWDTPLRVVAAFHYLVLRGESTWNEAPRDVLREHAGVVRRFLTQQTVQTNEVQRCWALLPCFLELARRVRADTLDLLELGASAGLNLLWDRHRYVYGAGEWGDADATLVLRGEERRAVPGDLLRETPHVRSRVGIDLAPFDVGSPETALLLKSFVWPDQEWRLEQLDAALEVARRDRPRLVEGDLFRLLPGLLAERRGDALTIVWQTAVLQYFPHARRREAVAMIAEAGRSGGPLAFVETVSPSDGSRTYYGLTARLWPGDGEPEELAHADFHGAWIDWRA